MKTYLLNLINKIRYLAMIIFLTILATNVWGATDIEEIANSSLPTWLKVIIIVVIAILAIGVTIKVTISRRNNSSNANIKGKDISYANASTIKADNSSIYNNTKGDNTSINNISGNSNVIADKIVVNMTTSDKIENKGDKEDEIFKLDYQTIVKLFSQFSKRILDRFIITSNDFNYIDRRVFDIRDEWYGIMNEGDFVIYDDETRKIIDDFYKPFDKLIRKCAFCYEPYRGNKKLSKFTGLVLDEFQSEQAEKNFKEIVNMTIVLQPFYKAMLVFVKRKYKLDFDLLSEEFEKKYINE